MGDGGGGGGVRGRWEKKIEVENKDGGGRGKK